VAASRAGVGVAALSEAAGCRVALGGGGLAAPVTACVDAAGAVAAGDAAALAEAVAEAAATVAPPPWPGAGEGGALVAAGEMPALAGAGAGIVEVGGGTGESGCDGTKPALAADAGVDGAAVVAAVVVAIVTAGATRDCAAGRPSRVTRKAATAAIRTNAVAARSGFIWRVTSAAASIAAAAGRPCQMRSVFDWRRLLNLK
jgi:hypothetical protein